MGMRKDRDTIEKRRAERANQKAKIHGIIRKAKSVPCADCKVQYPYYVMQFDHLPGTSHSKEFKLGLRSQNVSVSKVVAEIAKCEVVCANCHAERSYQRLMEVYGKNPDTVAT